MIPLEKSHSTSSSHSSSSSNSTVPSSLMLLTADVNVFPLASVNVTMKPTTMSPTGKSAEKTTAMLVAPKEMPTSNVTCGTAVTRGTGAGAGAGAGADAVAGVAGVASVDGVDTGDGADVAAGGASGGQINGGAGGGGGGGNGADADTDEMSLHVLSDVVVGALST